MNDNENNGNNGNGNNGQDNNPDFISPVIEDNYIVVLKEKVEHRKVSNEHAMKVHGLFPTINGFHGHIPKERIEKVKHDDRVLFVEPDVMVSSCAQQVPVGIKRIGTLNNPFAKIDGVDTRVNVDVAVIDTGICLSHPDLNVVAGVCYTGENTSGDDNNGHGSNVAGIIGAIDNGNGVVGVAPGVRLWAVKVLNATNYGTLSNFIKGVEYVTSNSGKISVANMSISGVGSAASLRLAIQKCVAKGVVFVVAAGNARKDIFGVNGIFGDGDDVFPAAFPEVMTVSAMIDTDGIAGGVGAASIHGPDDTICSFSNYSTKAAPGNPVTSAGLAIDVAAPGSKVYSTYKENGYASYSGTSQAAPHVAGVVALYVAEKGRAVNAGGVYSFRQTLINKAEPQSAWGPIQPCAYVSPRNGYNIVVGKEPLIRA